MTNTARTASQKPADVPARDGENDDKAAPRAPALPVDLEALADDVLAVLAIEAPKELERRKNKRKAEFLESVRIQALALGISPDRLRVALLGKSAARAQASGRADGRSSVKPKLRNPKDHSQTWSKRGAPPKWFQDHLAEGGSEDECLIPDGSL